MMKPKRQMTWNGFLNNLSTTVESAVFGVVVVFLLNMTTGTEGLQKMAWEYRNCIIALGFVAWFAEVLKKTKQKLDEKRNIT